MLAAFQTVWLSWGLRCGRLQTVRWLAITGQRLSDDQWRLMQPLIPPAKPGGRPRTTDMRRLLDSLFYLLRTGCQ